MEDAYFPTELSRATIGGILGLGGSGGTLVNPAMRALPVGVPKVMVATVASGNISRYVGPADRLHDVLGN